MWIDGRRDGVVTARRLGIYDCDAGMEDILPVKLCRATSAARSRLFRLLQQAPCLAFFGVNSPGIQRVRS